MTAFSCLRKQHVGMCLGQYSTSRSVLCGSQKQLWIQHDRFLPPWTTSVTDEAVALSLDAEVMRHILGITGIWAGWLQVHVCPEHQALSCYCWWVEWIFFHSVWVLLFFPMQLNLTLTDSTCSMVLLLLIGLFCWSLTFQGFGEECGQSGVFFTVHLIHNGKWSLPRVFHMPSRAFSHETGKRNL